ncbi:MAG: His/Gly/Thr/Pro-type tRNA ligase C-terminal domain-containing protein [Patescibacteria group bacterium]|nr:His/Gly/Thr/Pro-type tRNA ligase C-terminal domain-containing protein [Patescibacteria group bacterium]
MKQSQLFGKTTFEIPKDETSTNAQLLIRGGFVDKLMAGVYTYLPLGKRVLWKIENIIREEMNDIGGQEILMPALQKKEDWQTTGRWDIDVMMKVKTFFDKEYGLGWTHEEVVTPLAKKYIRSYKDFPFSVFQIQTKFRSEKRAKSGILRGREFSMKDLYSFHASEKDLDRFYDEAKDAYFKVFDRVGIKDQTYLTFASGGDFSKYSHEFQTIASAGEDTIYICDKCKIAVNKEIIEDLKNSCPKCGNKNLKEEKAIETGNIFKLKTRFSEAFNFKFIDENSRENIVLMGCYGLGPTRLMGTIIELSNDENGIIWPKSIAPYQVHLVSLGKDKNIINESVKIYKSLQEKKIEVLFDDRDESAGVKFKDSDLIGIPLRIVVSKKTLEKDSVEIKERQKKNFELIQINSLIEKIKELL